MYEYTVRPSSLLYIASIHPLLDTASLPPLLYYSHPPRCTVRTQLAPSMLHIPCLPPLLYTASIHPLLYTASPPPLLSWLPLLVVFGPV